MRRIHYATFILFLLDLAVVTPACTSKQVMNQEAPASGGTQIETADDYAAKIDRFSDGEAAYAGFYNNFEYRATIHNSTVRSALLQKQNQHYQWDRERFLKERDKSDQEMASETTVFLSFYTPDRHNDNLVDAKKSIWKIYLDAGGRRYEGKAKKLRSLLAELQTLYPYHTRWNTPYVVTFPVPTNAIESQEAVVTVTGPLGTKSVKFSAAK